MVFRIRAPAAQEAVGLLKMDDEFTKAGVDLKVKIV